jgi:tRNA pseudouridine55 synthase
LEQVPPMYSAIKHQGRRLYEFARRGVEVDRKPRTVTIKDLELLSFSGSRLECRVHCSKGTYVRTLAEQVGNALGCGAHIEELRRTSVAPFDQSRMVSLAFVRDRAANGRDALDDLLLPADSAIVHWPAIRIPANASHFLHNGQAITVPRAPAQGMVRLYEADDRFFGVGTILDDGRVAPRRLIRAG